MRRGQAHGRCSHRRSGVPTPIAGVGGFPGDRRRVVVERPVGPARAERAASVAALVGGLLLAAQASLASFCPYCSCQRCERWPARRSRGGVSPGRQASDLVVRHQRRRRGALVLAALVPAGGGLHLAARADATPQGHTRRLSSSAPGGKVTVVDFVDFECPFCRMTHAELAPLLAAHAERVRCVRAAPLHPPHAGGRLRGRLAAATSWCMGDELANALLHDPGRRADPQVR